MSQEIIYTSAPRGLKPGSRGFCTVVSTQGMAKNLAERLESLSGYRQVFPPQDPKAHWNPVVHSHLRLSVGGRTLHVLSRISAHGLDYTQRANKFAHHVVLDPSELPAAGPAWLISAPGFLEETWDGEPRILAAGRKPPTGAAAAGICQAWRQLAGDAGWGGVLAETALDPLRQAVIVFRPGMEMLPLLVESLNLLPAENRWGITFSTYFTKLPPGIDCKWRCMLEGTPEILAARRSPHITVIDLCRPAGRPPGGWLIEAARTGVVVAQKAAAPSAPDPQDDVDAWPAPSLPPSGLPQVAVAGASIPVGIGPPPLKPGATAFRTSPPQLRTFKKKRKRRWPLVLACSLFALTLIGGGAAIWLMQHNATTGLITGGASEAPSKPQTPTKASVAPTPETGEKPHSNKVAGSSKPATGASPLPSQEKPAPVNPEPVPAPTEKIDLSGQEAADALRVLPTAVDLPTFSDTATAINEETRLAPLNVPESLVCSLQLHSSTINGWSFAIKEDESARQSRRWNVVAQSTAESETGVSEQDVAELSLRDGALAFLWTSKGDGIENAMLSNSILEARLHSGVSDEQAVPLQTALIALRKPAESEPLPIGPFLTEPGTKELRRILPRIPNLPPKALLFVEILPFDGDSVYVKQQHDARRVKFSLTSDAVARPTLEFHAGLTWNFQRLGVEFSGTDIAWALPFHSGDGLELTFLERVRRHIEKVQENESQAKTLLEIDMSPHVRADYLRKKSALDAARKLQSLCEQVNGLALNYRIYTRIGDHKLELIRTPPTKTPVTAPL